MKKRLLGAVVCCGLAVTLGLYDMSGNVYEFTGTSGTSSSSASYKVKRGGSYQHDSGSIIHTMVNENAARNFVGFRVVCQD